MHIALVTDSYPPLRNSAAVQLRDLAREFARQGHDITVIIPAPYQQDSWILNQSDGANVLSLKTPKIKNISHVRRTLGELVMPFAMLLQLRKSPLANLRWDYVVWYAPSIFHGPLISNLKKRSGCKAYLIIRDIFPQWAVDMGLMGRGLPYIFFDLIARYQYSLADVIGVQTSGNKCYFERWQKKTGRKLEVLENWLGKPARMKCSINLADTPLSGRKLFVYAGNMGVAQGMDILLDLAQKLLTRKDIGFIFLGRGSDAERLQALAKMKKLDNVMFFDEIDPDEIPDLYTQCTVGIVALDWRHKTHNIPGKFLTYMQNGLPVLANINAGNDLAQMVRDERVGQVCETNKVDDLLFFAEKVLSEIEKDGEMSERCQRLFERKFAVENAVKQIVLALST
jgi:glycosyltransferase involved in cell wall biosynthesis